MEKRHASELRVDAKVYRSKASIQTQETMSLKTCWVMPHIVLYKVLSKISQCDDNQNLGQIDAVRISLLSSSFINWDSKETFQIWEKIWIATKLHYLLAPFFLKTWSQEGSEISKELIHRAKRDRAHMPVLPKPPEVHGLSPRGWSTLDWERSVSALAERGWHAAVRVRI